MKKILLLSFLTPAFFAAFSQAPIAYSSADYSGMRVGLTASYPGLDGYRCEENWSHHIESIRVPDGWKVELFEGTNYTGTSTELTSDVTNVSYIGWSDRIASIKVSRGGTLKDGICPCLKKAPMISPRSR